jgi:hypothetical protein
MAEFQDQLVARSVKEFITPGITLPAIQAPSVPNPKPAPNP